MTQFFLLIGAKGGVGVSTLSIELAKRCQQYPGTVLVDGDLSGKRSIAVALECYNSINENRNKGNQIATVVTDQGLEVVELTPNIHGGFTLKMADSETFVQELTQHSQHVFVDMPQPFAAAVRAFISRSTRIILVIEPSLFGVAGAQSMIEELIRFGIPVTRILLVLNQRDVNSEVSRRDIESVLGTSMTADIPHRTHRNYTKSLDSLLQMLLNAKAEDELNNLQPSTLTPIGDRRDPKKGPASNASTSADHQRRFAGASEEAEKTARRAVLKSEIHEQLIERLETLGTSLVTSDIQRREALAIQVEEIVAELVAGRSLESAEETARLRIEILNEALGFGPLEELMQDETITEIMVNGPNQIFVERSGRLILTPQKFAEEQQLRLVIERMLAPIGRRIDERVPMVDGRLADGSRINAIIPPLALDGPSLTIRRFGQKRLQISDLVRLGALTDPIVDFLQAMVHARLNIMISGGTGSGKTTFLNILSNFIPETERIVTIEDAAELMLNQEHVVRLESRPANLEGQGEIRIRDLVKNALRMRPERIIVGECRGGEAFDMLQAMNTGHDGSIATAHSNSPRDTISRIETMVMMAGFELPIRAIREQICSALDMIIQIGRLRDGSRKVLSITEVVGMEGDVVTLQEIIGYRMKGVDESGRVLGNFGFTGVQPNCMKRFEEYGIHFDMKTFAAMEQELSLC